MTAAQYFAVVPARFSVRVAVNLSPNPTHFISASSGFLGLHVRPGFLVLEAVVVQ